MKKRLIIIWITGLTLLILTIFADLSAGGQASRQILTLIRIPRVLTAMIAGAALALSGAQMQSIFRNPLADPHIMGISSGAALGAAFVTMAVPAATVAGITTATAAAAGAFASAMVILLASRRFRNPGTLLIFGVMLSFIVNAVVSTLQFRTDAESLKIFYSWTAGSFSGTTTEGILVMAAALLIGTSMSIFNNKGLDIILFGDEFASLSGAHTGRIRFSALLSCSIMTGAVTAFCGPLGFVGIVAPHIARAISKSSSHRIVIPLSLLSGSVIGVGADLVSQLSGHPLPIASTMAFVGIPIIIYIMIKRPSFSHQHE